MTIEEYRKKYRKEDVVNQVNESQQPEPTMAEQVAQKTEEYLDPNKSWLKNPLGNLGFIFKGLGTGAMETVANWGRGITSNVQNQVEIGQQKGVEQINQETKDLVKKQQFNLLSSLRKSALMPRNITN